MSIPLTEEQIAAAAEQLTSARLAIERIDNLGHNTPMDRDSAYRIADAHAGQLGSRSSGLLTT